MIYDLIVMGAGAGGCFSAIRLSELRPGVKICILESARKPLSKVEISGGGRCNVTHACFDPEQLVTYYPRGSKELLGPFYHFQPSDLIQWFKGKGVNLKKEEDGRMFPESNVSSTIIDCFLQQIHSSGIQLRTSSRAIQWGYDAKAALWKIEMMDGSILNSKYLLMATGSDQRAWDKLKEMGHQLISPVPSLFTFNIRDKNLTALQGISKNDVRVILPDYKLDATGPLLITHWGLSGPAILKLSAWGARILFDCNYVFDIGIRWLETDSEFQMDSLLRSVMKDQSRKQVHNITVQGIPSRLWKYLCTRAAIPDAIMPPDMSNKLIKSLVETLYNDTYRVTGKSTFKEEFVTAGGVDLKNVDMRRFESKIQPGLFLVGEVLNIDALTGGFNFQAAWTGAEVAAQAIADLVMG